MDSQVLAEVIAKATRGDVRELEISRLPGDGSDRRYWRAAFLSDGARRSFVVMDLIGVKNVVKSEEVTLYHPEDGELPFLNIHRFLRERGIPVPEVCAYERDRGLLLLQDLGDTLLLDAVTADPARKTPLYRQAIEILVKIHVDGTRARDERCLAFRQSFQLPLLMWEMRHFTEYGIEKLCGRERQVVPEDLAVIEDGYRVICERLASLPTVFTHRDYHSRNLLVRGDSLFTIDFQDALLGPAVYDLASLLRDSYIDVGLEFADRMVDFYLDLRERAGDGPLDRKEFRRDFDYQCLQRNLKAAGRFGFFDVVKGNPKFLADIPRTLSYVKRNLSKHAELRPLSEALAKYVPELR